MASQLSVAQFLGVSGRHSCFVDAVAVCSDHQSNVRTLVAGAELCLFLNHAEPAGLSDVLFSNSCDDVTGSDGPVNVQGDGVSGEENARNGGAND